MIEDEKIKAENEKIIREKAQAYKRLFMTKDGKRVLEDLSHICSYNATSVRKADSPDPYAVMFLEGKRWVYLAIRSYMSRKDSNA